MSSQAHCLSLRLSPVFHHDPPLHHRSRYQPACFALAGPSLRYQRCQPVITERLNITDISRVYLQWYSVVSEWRAVLSVTITTVAWEALGYRGSLRSVPETGVAHQAFRPRLQARMSH